MFKLDLEKSEEPEIKLPTFTGSQTKQGNSRKISTSVSLTMLKPLCGSQQTVENSKRDGNLYASQQATVRTLYRQLTDSGLRKIYDKAVYCHPVYLTQMQAIMKNAGMDELQSGIKISGRNINNLIYADDTTLMT